MEVVSRLAGSRPAAALQDTKGSSVSDAQPGSDARPLQTEPSAPVSPAAAGGAAATRRPETVTLPTRPPES